MLTHRLLVGILPSSDSAWCDPAAPGLSRVVREASKAARGSTVFYENVLRNTNSSKNLNQSINQTNTLPNKMEKPLVLGDLHYS
jgi:hypothetical protein